jgi:hypothetical protein
METKMSQQLTIPTAIISITEKKEKSEISFDETVTESIDEVFASLGENVKQAMYSYLENKYRMRKQQIPRMIEDFTNAIELIFGDASKLVELKIIEKLQSKVNGFSYKSKSTEMFFAEYLAALQKHLVLIS